MFRFKVNTPNVYKQSPNINLTCFISCVYDIHEYKFYLFFLITKKPGKLYHCLNRCMIYISYLYTYQATAVHNNGVTWAARRHKWPETRWKHKSRWNPDNVKNKSCHNQYAKFGIYIKTGRILFHTMSNSSVYTHSEINVVLCLSRWNVRNCYSFRMFTCCHIFHWH